MKYLKTYETIIKKTDSRAINNPFRFFIDRIEKILKKLEELDVVSYSSASDGYINTRIRRYYNDDGEITINYSGNAGFYYSDMIRFRIKESSRSNDIVQLTVACDIDKFPEFTSTRTNSDTKYKKNSIEFFNLIKDNLKEYINDYYNLKDNIIVYDIPNSELNQVLEKIEKFEEYIDLHTNTNQYNL